MTPCSDPLFRPRYRTALCSALTGLSLLACGGGGSTPTPTPSGNSGGNSGTSATLPTVDISPVGASDPGSSLVANWHKGAFMEIYVRGYRDSNGDGIGDLNGVTQKLDYLKDLGVKGIWLMPVTQSQDKDHGYAVSDYRNVETAYGNLADLDELLKQAHARGIGVILDYVMNHSAAENPLFVNSKAAASNPYRSWYVWQNVAPSGWNIYGNNPWINTANGAYFAAFSSTMPDFNLQNPDVIAYHNNNIRFWLNRGVDGLRFDAVGNLVENGVNAWNNQPESYAIMSQMRSLASTYAQRFVVCEAPGDPRGFTTACGSAFAFDHTGDIVNAARGGSAAIQAVADYFKTAPATISTMVSNHDAFAGQRLWDQVGGDLAQYRLAAATYLLQPGTPFIYYGEEIGMSGAQNLSGDWKIRTPMSWSGDVNNAGFTTGNPFRALASNVATQNVAAQQNDANSLLSFYKAMLKLRNSYPSIAQGSYAASFVNGSVMGFQRKLGNESTLVLINYGNSSASLSINQLSGSSLTAAYPTGAASAAVDGGGNAQLTIAAQSVAVYLLQP